MGFVGGSAETAAFRAIGMETREADSPEQVTAALHQLYQLGLPVIFISEKCAEQAPEAISRYRGDPGCAVIPVPGAAGSDGYGLRRVRENVEKAIGADILFNQ